MTNETHRLPIPPTRRQKGAGPDDEGTRAVWKFQSHCVAETQSCCPKGKHACWSSVVSLSVRGEYQPWGAVKYPLAFLWSRSKVKLREAGSPGKLTIFWFPFKTW